MTQVTQLKPGVVPGAYLLIGDKTEEVLPIDRGATRITGLVASVSPSRYYSITAKVPTSEVGQLRDDTRYTGLRAGVLSGGYYAILDKTPSTDFTIPANDTYLVYMSLSWTDTVVVEVTETFRPILTLSGSPQIVIPASDTFRPVLTLVGNPPITSGATPVSRSDTYVPVLTLATADLLAAEWYTSSDTYVPVLALSTVTLSTEDVKTSSDTYKPVLSFGFTLTPHTSQTLPVQDTYTINLTLAGQPASVVTDVDRIVGSLRPYGQITGKWI